MIKTSRTKLAIGLVALILASAFTVRADDEKSKKEDAVTRLQRSGAALEKLADVPDKGIPDEVLRGAKCMAVIPNLTKAGFIVGVTRGRGVSTCRLANGRWSAPAFFTLTGGNWGAQIGVEDVTLVILIMNDKGMNDLLRDKVQIGAEASASAGPVGRHASAGTDWKLETEMLTYSRSKGLFAGVDLGGSYIERDKDTNAAMYGRDVTTAELLTGKVPPPPEARPFLTVVSNIKAEAKNPDEKHVDKTTGTKY
jgi:lipid-binding SYLF domain-containing protein